MVVYVCVTVCVRRGVVGSVVYGVVLLVQWCTVCTVWCCWFGTSIIVLSYLSLARYRDKYK